jgi:hypothetical protein
MQFIPSYFGTCREKEMLKASMIKRDRVQFYRPFFSKPYFGWSFATALPRVSSCVDFLFSFFFFLFLICRVFSLVYFMNFLYLYIKKGFYHFVGHLQVHACTLSFITLYNHLSSSPLIRNLKSAFTDMNTLKWLCLILPRW